MTEVNPQIIYDLLEKDFLPIICPIGFDSNYVSYNINADDAACAIARAVNAEKLAFLTDVEGVYKDYEDKNSLISEMTAAEAKEFVASGMLGLGMLPKLQNCVDAIENGVNRVHILDGRIPHCLLLEIFTNKGIAELLLFKQQGGETAMTEKEQVISRGEQVVLRDVITAFPVVFDHGKGMYLYDIEGNQYLDFGGRNCSHVSLGYGDSEFTDALKSQMDKLTHIPLTYFISEPAVKAGEELAGSV